MNFFFIFINFSLKNVCFFFHVLPWTPSAGNYCLPELSQPSPVTVVPMVALPPPGPRLHREQFRRSKKAILRGVPATRQQANASCILLRPWMPPTRFAKLLCELGRTTHTASLSQEVTLCLACTPDAVARCPTHSVRASFAFAAPPDVRLSHTSQCHCRPLRLKT